MATNAANVSNINGIVAQAREAFKAATKNAIETAASVAANNASANAAMTDVRAANASLNAVRIFAEKGTSSAALDAAVNAAAQTVNIAEVNAANVAATGINRNQAAADQVNAAKAILLAVLQMKQQQEHQLAAQESQHKRQFAVQKQSYDHELAKLNQMIAALMAADIAKEEKQRQDKLAKAAAALDAEIAELST